MMKRFSQWVPALVAAARRYRDSIKQERQVILLYGAWTLFFFLIFLVTTFPHRALISHILSSRLDGTVAVSLGDVRLAPPLGYRIASLDLTLPEHPEPPLLEATELRLVPSVTALLRLRLTPLSLDARTLGGEVNGRLDLTEHWLSLRLALDGCNLARASGLRHWITGSLAGRLDGRIEVDAARPGVTSNSGSLEIRLTNTSIENARLTSLGSIMIPDLHFDSIVIRGTVKNGRVQIVSGVARGSELSGSLTGVMMLAQPLDLTALNLVLSLKPAPGAPPATTLLLGLLPSRGESTNGPAWKVRIFGTLAHPSIAAA